MNLKINTKRTFILLALYLMASVGARCQTTCNLHLVSESDLKCLVDGYVQDDLVIRACRGNTVWYLATGATFNTYSWSAHGGTVTVDPQNPARCSVAWDDGEQGYVEVTATDLSGLQCTASSIIMLEDRPTAGIISIPNYVVDVGNPAIKTINVCMGDSLTFIDNSESPTSPITKYYWECAGLSSSYRTFSFKPQTTGTFTLVHRAYNECGCYGEDQITLKIGDECPFSLSCNGTVCAGQWAAYTAQDVYCSDYIWYVEGGELVSGQHSPTISVLWGSPASGYGTVYLDGGSCSCPCRSRRSVKVPVISGNVAIDGPDTCCAGSDQLFSLPLWGSTEYTWTVTPPCTSPLLGIPAPNQIECHFATTGTYTVSVTYECPFLQCGPYTVTKQVVVLDSLKIIGYDTVVCPGTQVSFSSNAGGGVHWRLLHDNEEVELDSPTGSTLSHLFRDPGFYTVMASANGFCNTAHYLLQVLPQPPMPTDIQGPHIVCMNTTAYYSVVPTNQNYYIEWAWHDDLNSGHTFNGDAVAIAFGNVVDDITVTQIDRRTGCRSEPVVYEVDAFALQPWPYPDTIHVCEGQTLVLDRLEDQSDVVLYRWRIPDWKQTPLVSVQTDHFLPTITALVNYTNPTIPSALMEVKREYCSGSETRYIRIVADGNIAPPVIDIPPAACTNIRTAWVIDDRTALANMNPDQSYWLLDNSIQIPVSGYDTTFYVFHSTLPNSHTVRLHYVSVQGCDAETQDVTISIYDFPEVALVETGGQLCVQGGTGLTYQWSTGSTDQCIPLLPDIDYYFCTVSNASCSTKLYYIVNNETSCTECTSAVSYTPICMNMITITINNNSIPLPAVLTIINYSGHKKYINLTQSTQNVWIPFSGNVNMRIDWFDNGNCYYSQYATTINETFGIEYFRDCATGEMIVYDRSQYLANAPYNTSCTVYDETAQTTYTCNFTNQNTPCNFNIPADGRTCRIKITDNNTIFLNSSVSCDYEITVQHGPPPSITSIDIPDDVCEHDPVRFSATATGKLVEYKWDFGDYSYNYGAVLDHVYNSRGKTITKFDVTLTVTDDMGCQASLMKQIAVHQNDLTGIITANPSMPPLCSGTPVTLNFNCSGGGSPSDMTYNWYPDDGTMGNASIVDVTHGGRFTALETRILDGCQIWRDKSINYPNGCSANIFCNANYCVNDKITLYGDNGPDFQYSWTVTPPNNGIPFTSTYPNFSFTATAPGLYSATLQVTYNNCPPETDTKTFMVNATPVPSIGFTAGCCLNNTGVELQSMGGNALNWSNGAFGPTARFYTAGGAGAYYRDPATGCRSVMASTFIPIPPDFDALLTGCYKFCNGQANHLPVFDYRLIPSSWEWLADGVTILEPPSPAPPLPLPSSAEYRLNLESIGGTPPCTCSYTSPALTIAYVSCNGQTPPIVNEEGLPLIITEVNTKCVSSNCELFVRSTVTISNPTDEYVSVDHQSGSTVSPAISPFVIVPHASFNMDIYFPLSSTGHYLLFLYDALDNLVGYYELVGYNMADCISFKECGFNIQALCTLNSAMTITGTQTVYLDYLLSMPSSVNNVMGVWSDAGQVVSQQFSAPNATGTLMLDYGWLTQAVLRGDSVCLHLYCCQRDDEWCTCSVCIPASCLYAAAIGDECVKGTPQAKGGRPRTCCNGSQSGSLTARPNPTTGEVTIADAATGMPLPRVEEITVLSLVGQTMGRTTGSNTIDLSALPVGVYMLKVVTGDGIVEHLKITKY